MEVTHLRLYDVLLIKPDVYRDNRGYVFESYQEKKYKEAGVAETFVQDVHSHSTLGVVRGLHAQRGMGKLVRAAYGAIFDVAVDLRPSSPTFSQWVGCVLSDRNHLQLWIPDGFGHGLMALTPTVDVSYKMTRFFSPSEEVKVRWDDQNIGVDWYNIEWPLRSFSVTVSDADAASPCLAEVYPRLQEFYGNGLAK